MSEMILFDVQFEHFWLFLVACQTMVHFYKIDLIKNDKISFDLPLDLFLTLGVNKITMNHYSISTITWTLCFIVLRGVRLN